LLIIPLLRFNKVHLQNNRIAELKVTLKLK